MPKNHIVILNGPPGCGKDAMAKWFTRMWEYGHLAFKEPIFDTVLQLTCKSNARRAMPESSSDTSPANPPPMKANVT